MMQACKPDWNLIQSLYFKGFTPKQISEQTGVKALNVSVQASRKGWRKALLETSALVVKHNEALPAKDKETPALSRSSERVRSGLAGVLERSIDRLEQLSFKTPKAALKANAELECVVRNAKTVFGWSEGQSSPLVRIAILSQSSILESVPVPVLDPRPVIECESTSVPVLLPLQDPSPGQAQ